MFNSNVEVIGHNSDEVVIEARNYKGAPARAAGLRPINNHFEDNTGMGIHVTKENNLVRIKEASSRYGKYTIKVPKNATVVIQEGWQLNMSNLGEALKPLSNLDGDKLKKELSILNESNAVKINKESRQDSKGTNNAVDNDAVVIPKTNRGREELTMSNLDGEIELKLEKWNANLTNVTGPVVANATSSDIVVKFSSLNQSEPSTISIATGTVDIHLPANTKADFKLRTMQGEIYSDFEMNIPKETKSNLRRITGGNTIEGNTNGGGVELNLYTISGDMFIRKSK
ncbi:hypothetical protein [Pontibacter toksunensis]